MATEEKELPVGSEVVHLNEHEWKLFRELEAKHQTEGTIL